MKKNSANFWVVLLFIALFMLLFFNTLLTEFSASDEIWNFQNIYKMWSGGLIYQNNNVIVTPIFFLFGHLLFSIFGANVLIFRVYNTCIYFSKYVLIFLIFRKLKDKKIFCSLYTLLFFLLDFSFVKSGANYNTLAITFCLLGILWFLTHHEKKSYHFVQGLVIFLVFFSKQTTGIYYAFGVVLFELLEMGWCKKFFQNQGLKLCTFLPCLFISLAIFYQAGNLLAFWDLCFGSILEFGTSNHTFSYKNIFTFAFMTFTIIFSIFILRKQNILPKSSRKTIKFLLILAITLSFNMFPLANLYHMNMSLLFYLLLFLYLIDLLLIRELFTTKSQFYTIFLISFLIIYISFFKLGYLYFSNMITYENFDKNHPFYNAPISSETKQRMNVLTNYISKKATIGTKVVVLSYEAANFMVPLNLNNGTLDLPLQGNFGYHGIQKTIDKIADMKQTEFLIFTKDEDCFYQESKQIREYILNHFKKNGEILNYSIYINK